MALLAHVDAGKTTLSESILFNTGAIRKEGRVDHRDSFLDTEKEERERGITIFSKQALFNIGENKFTLIDTPGHADFSAEMERALSVLDFAVLIISAPDGIHGHDITLWKLLKAYRVPTLIFVNKLDQPGADARQTYTRLRSYFGEGCIDFNAFNAACSPTSDNKGNANGAKAADKAKAIDKAENANEARTFGNETDSLGEAEIYEAVAELDEPVMEHYFAYGRVERSEIIRLFNEGKLHPIISGSALKSQGVDRLLKLINYLCEERIYPDTFAARVFKLTHDSKGGRLIHVRINGGVLKPKDVIRVSHRDGRETTEEKVNRILLYSGSSFKQIDQASAGMVVCLDGIASALPGDAFGAETAGEEQLMTALFAARVSSPDEPDVHKLYQLLKELETEIPEISVGFNERSGEITVKLMGEVQTDIIRSIVKERHDIRLEFSESSIVYKETLSEPVIAAGHFEPLRHYAEVHLLIEPLERGSGIELCSRLSEDVLSKNWQKQILSELAAKRHIGALLGAELTDVRISLINGRAHEKHTEGGDFREAAWRAVRYGALKAREEGKAALLEPYYEFTLTVPDKNVGRAMNDLSVRAEHFEGPKLDNGMAGFKGCAAVSDMRNYASEVTAYTGGFGSLELSFGGYGSCRQADNVIAAADYEPELDADNPAGSVFCSHGAGYYVPWFEADKYFHLSLEDDRQRLLAVLGNEAGGAKVQYDRAIQAAAHTVDTRRANCGASSADSTQDYMGAGLQADKELEEIFYRSLGGNRGRNPQKAQDRASHAGDAVRRNYRNNVQEDGIEHVEIREAKKQYLLVDGYNVIFAWPMLNEMAKDNLDGARLKLMDILANYQGYRGMTLILVFDAYKVKGNHGSVERYHNIYVVYTREAQTADAYIEKTVHEIGKRERVTVATSDGLEQTIVFGEGAVRMSARELAEEVETALSEMRENHIDRSVRVKNTMELPAL